MKIAILPGDGIGPEIVAEAVKVLKVLDLKFETEQAPVGGAAYEAKRHPLPESTLNLAMQADAVLFGAVGDWKYDKLERALRPEQAILGLRKHLELFANFRPAICYPQLTGASSISNFSPSALSTFTASLTISGPMPSPGSTAIFILSILAVSVGVL